MAILPVVMKSPPLVAGAGGEVWRERGARAPNFGCPLNLSGPGGNYKPRNVLRGRDRQKPVPALPEDATAWETTDIDVAAIVTSEPVRNR